MDCWKVLMGGVLFAAIFGSAVGAGEHKDHELGFRINIPDKWRKVPVAAQEQWIVAKYLSPREYEAKKSDFYERHTPELRVIVFPHSVTKDRGVEAKESESGRVILKFKNPYQDYKAYLKGNAQGGYFISKEENRSINGIATLCLEVKFEKLTTPRRQLAWVFQGPDADWVVTIEAMEDYFDKLQPEFEKSLRSFKLIERAGNLKKGDVITGEAVGIDLTDVRKTPEQRAKSRQQLFDAELKTSLERLPGDWVHRKSKNFVALAHTDAKFADKILDQAEALRMWLDQNLDFCGSGKPGPIILRICKDYEEYKSYATQSVDSWIFRSFEVVTYKDVDDGMRSASIQYLNLGILNLWSFDKNPRLTWGMPGWLRYGMIRYLITATVKNGKLDFRPDEWEMNLIRDSAKKGELAVPQKLMKSTWQEFSTTPNPAVQAGRFFRFLMSGPQSGTSKGAFRLYMDNLLEVIAEEDKERAEIKGEEAKPKTEEEEEALFKERKQREKNRLIEVFDRTFGTWTESDWKNFEKAYRDWAV